MLGLFTIAFILFVILIDKSNKKFVRICGIIGLIAVVALFIVCSILGWFEEAENSDDSDYDSSWSEAYNEGYDKGYDEAIKGDTISAEYYSYLYEEYRNILDYTLTYLVNEANPQEIKSGELIQVDDFCIRYEYNNNTLTYSYYLKTEHIYQYIDGKKFTDYFPLDYYYVYSIDPYTGTPDYIAHSLKGDYFIENKTFDISNETITDYIEEEIESNEPIYIIISYNGVKHLAKLVL